MLKTNRFAPLAIFSALLCAVGITGAVAGSPPSAIAFPWQVPKEVTERWEYRGPSGVALAADGRILVADEFNAQVQVFSPDGKRLMTFGGTGAGAGRFDRPTGLAVDAKGAIYVVDSGNDRIQKFDAKGVFVAAWGRSGEGDGQFRAPRGVALDAAGNLYVTDTLNYRVQVLGPEGTFKTKWGTQGDGPGQFHWPNGIAVTAAGEVWVSDSVNNRLLRFDSTGKPRGRVDGAESGLNWPAGLAVDKAGTLYVADSQNRRIKLFSRDGKLQRTLGGDGVEDVRFEFPHSLAVSPDGATLYSTDWLGNRLQVLDAQGAGKGGWKVTAEGRFNCPDKVFVDRRGGIVVADAELCNIQVLDTEGFERATFGIPGVSSPFRFMYSPYSVAGDAAGNVYLASASGSVPVYDAQGRCVRDNIHKCYGYPGPVKALGVAIGSQGSVVVLGRSSPWQEQAKDPENAGKSGPLQRFKPDGTWLGEIKLTGATLQRMDQIATDQKNNLYVQDGPRVVKFDATGKYLGEIQGPGWIAWAPAGEVFYGLTANYEVEKYGADGHLLKKWDAPRQPRVRDGRVVGGLAAGVDGNVYVTDAKAHRVLVYTADGDLVMQMGHYAPYPKNHGDHGKYFYPIPASTSEAVLEGERPVAFQARISPNQQYRDRFASDLELLANLEQSLMANAATAAKAGDDYVRLVQHCLNVAGSPDTCADIARTLDAVEHSLGRVRAALPASAPLTAELRRLEQGSLEQAVRHLADRRASRGRCVVWIGGKQLNAATHSIVMPDQPTPSEERAARELRNYLEQMTGQDIPTIRDAEANPANRTLLVVGRSRMLERLGVALDWSKLGTDGIALSTAGVHLVLAGGQRGVLYAVYTFLEDHLGCHWYTQKCTAVPTRGERRVDKLALTYVPIFEYREQVSFSANDPDWAVRNKYLGRAELLNDARGGGFGFMEAGHSFYYWVPPSKYFKEHPEYFSMIKGERKANGAQLCLSNPEVENIVVQRIDEEFNRYPWFKIASVSQMDWAGYCECPQCAAVDAEEGSPSGSILRFVNRVAERIEKTHPDKLIHTFAYQYSRQAPRLAKARQNVVVQLCSIECNQGRPLNDPDDKLNAPFAKDLKEWMQVSKRLYIWDYAADFQHQWLQPNLWTRKANLHLFAASNVRGVMQQQVYLCTHELQEERTWLLAKLLWNPAADDKALFAQFLEAYYGPAAGPVARYYQQAHEYVQQHNVKLDIGWGRAAEAFPLDELMKYEALFEEAVAAARGDVTFLHRVEKARLPVLANRIMLEKDSAKKAELLDWYERVAKREGMTQWKEKSDGPSLDGWLYEQRRSLVAR